MATKKFVENPKVLRSDNEVEYINNKIENYLRKNSIRHQLTVPHCLSQNGVTERKNRTLI